MTKAWDTKRKMLDLIRKRRMTLTDLSKELDLAPSTVNQHLKELLSANAIRQVNNEFYVKLKYYELNPDFGGLQVAKAHTATPGKHPLWRVVPILAVIAIVSVVLAGAYLGAQKSNIAAAAPVQTVFSISDSPTVSSVSAVNITVDSAMVHSTTTGKWSTVLSTPESFNLVTLRNVSALLAATNLSAGQYDQILLYVSNASAVVNNQSESAFIPTNTLRIVGAFSVGENGTAPSWINIDVNLQKSLYITSNGSVVLLPVISLTSQSGASLGVAANGIITVNSPGRPGPRANYTMNIDGNFTPGTQPPIPQGFQVGIMPGGRIGAMPAMPSQNSVWINARNGVIFINNVTNASSLVGNLSAQENLTFPGRAIPTSFRCYFINGSASCSVDGNLSIGPLPKPCGGRFCPAITNSTLNASTNSSAWWNASANGTNPGNLPPGLNSSVYSECQASANCSLVHITACWNGLTSQSACIDSNYTPQYNAWYNSTFAVNTIGVPNAVGVGPCPLYIIYNPVQCGCVSGRCAIVKGPAT